MKKLNIIIFLIFPLFVFSQRIKSSEVIKTSDSILISEVGEKIFRHFKISEGSYYIYKKNSKSKSYGKFLSHNKLKKNVTEIWVLYSFKKDDLSSGLWLKMNENLKLIEPLKLNFIPNFLKRNEPSNFISNQNAKQIAINSFKKISLEVEDAKLIFDEKREIYIYRVISKVSKTTNISGKETGETEIAEIDALSGNLLNISKGYYGLVIR